MRVWNCPVLPVMPCVMTLVLLSTRMLMRFGASIVVPAKAGTECRYVRRPRAGGDPVSFRRPRAGGDPVSLPGDFAVQIAPIRIRFLDQPNLPCAPPLL